MKHEDLTSRLIGICIKVHSILGPGLLESVYEEAVCIELKRAGINFLRQQGIKVRYEDEEMGLGFRADLIIENLVVLELKSVEAIAPVHSKTVITYLRFTGLEVGLLINFNVDLLREGITRLIYDHSRLLNR
jgi:GxxExxY protein